MPPEQTKAAASPANSTCARAGWVCGTASIPLDVDHDAGGKGHAKRRLVKRLPLRSRRHDFLRAEPEIERVQYPRMADKIAPHRRAHRREKCIGPRQPAFIAGEAREPDERRQIDRMRVRDRVVGCRREPQNHIARILGRHGEKPACRIAVIGLHRLRPANRIGKIIAGKRWPKIARFMQRERGPHHRGMIERETRFHKHARAPGMGEAPVSLRIGILHRVGDERIGPRGERDPFGLMKQRRGMDERGDHQPIPIGENLVVEARPDALFAGREKFRAQRRQPRFLF